MRQSVPIMAYHCKFFAVKKGLQLCNDNPGEMADKAKSFLIQELGDLETMKAAMGDVKQEEVYTVGTVTGQERKTPALAHKFFKKQDIVEFVFTRLGWSVSRSCKQWLISAHHSASGRSSRPPLGSRVW